MLLSQEITATSHNESFKKCCSLLFSLFFLVIRSSINAFIKNEYENLSTHFVVKLNEPKGTLSY